MAEKRSRFRALINTTPKGVYTLSKDETVDSGKTYYEKDGDAYTKVTNPSGNPSTSGWYEYADTAKYALLGDGITGLAISYNPQTQTDQYIHQDTAVTEVTGYQPNAPVTTRVMKGDEAFEFINAMRRRLPVMSDSYTDIVLVDLYEDPVDGKYIAQRQNVSIQFDNYGGEASDPLTVGYTINWRGGAVDGLFDPDSRTFTPAA